VANSSPSGEGALAAAVSVNRDPPVNAETSIEKSDGSSGAGAGAIGAEEGSSTKAEVASAGVVVLAGTKEEVGSAPGIFIFQSSALGLNKGRQILLYEIVGASR
jgi:hypothetical protein